jgi:hypothetical protein
VRRRFLLVLLCLAVLPACSRLDGLAFREDTRVDVVAPHDRAKVALPITVRWTSRAPVHLFGVFVDRSPMPPGKTLDWFARDDDACKGTPGCPSVEYLAERNVFSTTRPSFTVERLLDTQRDGQRREFHEVTVVLLDGAGRRIGESAWSVEFQVKRDRG